MNNSISPLLSASFGLFLIGVGVFVGLLGALSLRISQKTHIPVGLLLSHPWRYRRRLSSREPGIYFPPGDLLGPYLYTGGWIVVFVGTIVLFSNWI